MKTVRMVVHKVFVQNGGTNSPIYKRLDFGSIYLLPKSNILFYININYRTVISRAL